MLHPPYISTLPKWQCHKQVNAIKIASIEPSPQPHFAGAVCRSITGCGHCERCKWYQSGGKDSYVILPADERFPSFTVSTQYVAKHQPKAGGYFVVYEDGYESFSPAESFESGYSLIDP